MGARGEASARSIARAAFFRAVELSGGVARRCRRLVATDALVVLNLHRVSPQRSPYWPPLHPARFEDLVRFLTRRCDLTSFDALADREGDGRPPVVLSFDDGYRDFVDYAMPVLDRYRVRANQNIVPTSVLTGRPPWSVQLTDFLASAPAAAVAELRVPGFSPTALPSDEDGRARFGNEVANRVKALSRLERAEWWDQHQSLLDSVDVRETAMMDLRSIQEAAQSHQIGVHSFSHESMGAESATYFAEDFARCHRFFTERLGLSLGIYAFPHGSYRVEQIDHLLASGIRHVLLVGEKESSPHGVVHPRFTLFGSTSAEVRVRSLGWTRRRATE